MSKRKRKHTEKVLIGLTDTFRRDNLLTNARNGLGTAKQFGKHVLLTIYANHQDYEFIEYLITNAQLNEST